MDERRPPPPAAITMAITPSTFKLQTPQTTDVEINLTITNTGEQPFTILTARTIFSLSVAQALRHSFRCKDLATDTPVHLETMRILRGPLNRISGGGFDRFFVTCMPHEPVVFREKFQLAYRRPPPGKEHIPEVVTARYFPDMDDDSSSDEDRGTNEDQSDTNEDSSADEDSNTGGRTIEHTASESTIVRSPICDLDKSISIGQQASPGRGGRFMLDDDASTTSSKTCSGTSKSTFSIPGSNSSEHHAVPLPSYRIIPRYLSPGSTYLFWVGKSAVIKHWAWGTKETVMVDQGAYGKVWDEEFDPWFHRANQPIRLGDIEPVEFTVEE